MGGFSSKPSKSNSNSNGSMNQRSSNQPTTKKIEINSIDRTILDLKNSRDRLQKYKLQCEKDYEKITNQIIKAKQNNQIKMAMNLLKLRTMKKNAVHTCDEQLCNVLLLVNTIDSKRNDQSILAAMEQGKNTLQKLHEETSIEQIIHLMETIQDEHLIEEEMNKVFHDAAIENSSMILTAEDEKNMEAELMAMISPTAMTTEQAEQQQEQQPLPEVPDTPLLPVVPTHEPVLVTPTTTISASTNERIAVPGS